MKNIDKISSLALTFLAIFILLGAFFFGRFYFGSAVFNNIAEVNVDEPYDPTASLEFLEKWAPSFEKNQVAYFEFWQKNEIIGQKENPFITKK